MTKPIAQWVADLKRLDVQFTLEDNSRLRCSAPEGTLTTELQQELRDRKAEILSYLQSSSVQSSSFPLSFAQQRLWFLYQLAPDSPFYNVPAAIRLTGKLDHKALARSLELILQRHDALRTTFTTVDGKPVQIVNAEAKLELSIVNLSTVTAQEQISQQLATAEAQRPFNLSTDALLRVTVLQFDPTDAVLLLTMHHIVADGWSLGVLIRELAHFYAALVEERSPELPPLPIQYPDFVRWQREWLQGEILEQQLAYWSRQLQGLPRLDLPTDRPRPATQTYQGATYPLQFSAELTEKLEALSQESGVSLFMTLLAAFQTLLHRYTGQTDIAIGTPIANRHRSELEGLIGFFVNSVVMRSQFPSDLTVRELLEQVRTVAIEAYEHQDLPFEKLVEELEPERDLSRNPLFQVAFALQNAPMQALQLPGLRLDPLPLESRTTRFDLEVHLWEPTHGLRSLWQSQEGLSGFISYSTDLFDRDRIARLVGHFQTLLAGIVANPDARLSELPLLTTPEHQQILVDWNQTNQEIEYRCLHQIFEAQVQRQPDAIAVVAPEETLTYRELNQRADQLAQILRHRGVQTESLVGLCVDRSIEMVIGILGIFKAGGAYVPLDPNYPQERLHFMMTDTQVAIVLTQSWLVDSLPTPQAQILCLDQSLSQTVECSEVTLSTPDQLAYVIYTSGSTGTPKGVLLTHQGLCNVVEAQRQIFHLSCTSRILQFSALSFDASIFEIALCFGSGGTLYIPPESAQLPGTALLQFLQDNAITHALMTPSVLAVLPFAEIPSLKVLITGGETCSSQIVDRWAVDRHFFNAYGPTEATIWATVAELQPGDNPHLIGRPIPNTQIYVLDANLNPVPVGVPGELYMGGEGLARGYLNRPELTAERFISTEFSKLYKTGDRAFYHANGDLEFLGRVDDQIKLRGLRVELGEIEATLQRHPLIRAATVTAIGDANDLRLIAYFSLEQQQLQQAILQSLQAQQLQHWQTLYDQTYQCSASQFNITGWNSSYTGQPIPLEEMQEWVSDRVQQILALNPARILEIGCGTGLLLFQLAPHCQKYVGTDFSKTALASIQTQLTTLPQVELLHRDAADLEGIDPASFDVVILNSIVQYFPTVDYLMQVLEEVIPTVAPNGVLFLGDIRSLPLLGAFHSWVQFCQADASLDRTQLNSQVQRSQFEDPELAIAPTFFYTLRDRFPQIQRVQIRLIRGRAQNEMTQFRYNVLLHLGNNQPTQQAVPADDWADGISIEAIQKVLTETKPKHLLITNIPNRRVNAAIRTAHWLNRGEAPKTVGQMRDVLQDFPELAIDPQDWWELETVLPYTVEITWSSHLHTGDYHVLFIRHDVVGVDFPITQSSKEHQTNHPLQSQFARQLIPQFRQFLGQTLPDYMIPSAFMPLETLPLTVNGKIDRRALPTLTEAAVQSSTAARAATETEATLLEIWQDLLRLRQVTIHDNFFELGGHSLLATQMTSRVRDTFGLELPLKSVFEAPTIAQLAPLIETLQNTASLPQKPPLVRLDRSAYRRTRFSHNNVPNVVSEPPINAWSPLVPLTLGGSREPFFCVHPMFGVVFPYLELANCLESDRSFYGLQPLGLDGKAQPLNRIEAIAAYYIQAIRARQPQGPYFLGGWSFGGLVAFEMAQQLKQSGEQVSLLAILDTIAPCNKLSLRQSLKFLLGTALWSTLPFILDYGTLMAQRFRVSHWQWEALSHLIPEASRLRLLDESAIAPMLRIVYANAQAVYRYSPQYYGDRITVFKAVESPENEPTLGWNNLTPDLQLHSVPGNHLSLLKSPHVQTLAQQLRHHLR